MSHRFDKTMKETHRLDAKCESVIRTGGPAGPGKPSFPRAP